MIIWYSGTYEGNAIHSLDDSCVTEFLIEHSLPFRRDPVAIAGETRRCGPFFPGHPARAVTVVAVLISESCINKAPQIRLVGEVTP